MNNRAQWGTRLGFILAACGSAIGLGNIWRFPATAYESGGGAFFIPYLIALLTAGIPLLIMEFSLGHKFRGSAPLTFSRMNKKAEWLGWWAVFVSFVISTYYGAIIAWAIMYAYFSFGQKWGTDTETFLYDFLGVSQVEAGQTGVFVPEVLIPILIVWAVVLFVLYKGVRKGIELANRIFIPTLAVIFLIIVIRAVTLDGAGAGLDAFFSPDFSRIWEGEVWVAAYGQIFFSLSIAFAIMITYSSYLDKKSDITGNAFIVGFGNSSFELLAGIGVFSALGYLATQMGEPVSEVVAGGVGLAFVIFPLIINEFPGMNGLFGFLFFASLVLAGMSSLISIVETYVAGFSEKFNISRSKAVIFGGGLAMLVSLIFATQGGLNFLDTADYFINQFGVAFIGLVEVIMIAWFLRKLGNIQEHANSVSSIKLGGWWKVSLGIITPLILGYMMFDLFKVNLLKQHTGDNNTTGNYGGYEDAFIIYGGWFVAAAALIIGLLFTLKKWNPELLDESSYDSSKEDEAV
ncbi:sodium-dependent transporter [Tenuibacillus multivorans]|uniref:Neurotransmitter:Na+ symporter, NSS family n=1 Tax=Tenuibacillus multivorans TaxID=237069 RepID=A0A1H0FUA8_9BACI|nr:sodium-dependent transporter [Tenuibacillus multivorans]GEL77875.1 transporter [Tenuibacillus multivorans]SDN98230.1 neurotransmitter:Na+ symporter, NSS family [Tenuibacillus multivorans]